MYHSYTTYNNYIYIYLLFIYLAHPPSRTYHFLVFQWHFSLQCQLSAIHHIVGWFTTALPTLVLFTINSTLWIPLVI